MESKEQTKTSEKSDLFQLPPPIIEIVRHTEAIFSSQFVTQYRGIITKLCEWTLFYSLCYFGFGFGWVLFFISVYYLSSQEQKEVSQKVIKVENQQELLKECFSALPSWVSFPDFDRVEWINHIISQLWNNVDSCATFYVKELIEPELHKILDLMRLNQVSGFRVKSVDLGTIPARLDGIKVYDKKILGSKPDEIVLDCDVVYAGDARVIFTLQGISAQIKDIKFRGTARVHLKPLLNGFPFIGGFEMYFLNMPTLDYGLGGVGTFGEVPGVNSIVRSVCEDVIRTRFVWPNKFKLYFPLGDIEQQDKTSYMLPRPAGLITVTLKEARDLVKKDKHFGGSGKSDPYAVVSIGNRKVSFQDRYVPKTVNPTWDYSTSFVMEDPSGQNIDIEVYDFDKGSEDDSLGNAAISLSNVTEQNIKEKKTYDKWVALSEVKSGEVHVCCSWNAAIPASEDVQDLENFYILSVLIDRCHALVGGKASNPSLNPKCKVRLEGGNSTERFKTLPKSNTENPVFEEGFLLTSNEPNKEKLVVEVIDVKGIDTVLGVVTIPITYLMATEHKEEMNKGWTLEGGHPDAKIYISSKLYTVQ